MKREKDYDRLLSDVLEAGHLREATLQHGLRALRRKRGRQHAARLAGVTVSVLALALVVLWNRPHRQTVEHSHAPPPASTAVETIAGTDIRVLSDDELLAMFKGRPVALVGPPGRQQLLLFEQP